MLHRKLSDKAYYRKDSEKVHLWIHLLLSANRGVREEQLGGKPIVCLPGQFTTGRKQLSLETGISESKIERILTYFEKSEQQIEQRKTTTNRLITVLNWSEYQASEQQIEQQVNNDRTTIEQQVNTLQQYKEVKKEINILFAVFWDAYNKKEGDKRACEKKWNKLTDDDRQKIMDTLPAFKSKIKDKQYQPYPVTYLNQRRWDNIEESKPPILTNSTPAYIDNDWEIKKLKQLGLK